METLNIQSVNSCADITSPVIDSWCNNITEWGDWCTQYDTSGDWCTRNTYFPYIGLKCLGGGGVIDPQFITVEQWDGPEDYRTIEGAVIKSTISDKDNFLNHADHQVGQDIITYILPDPKYTYLLSTNPQGGKPYMGLEWERGSIPDSYRPTAGDRVSVFGYWIHDCGHPPYYTEIHPPVGMAVHRYRPIKLPEDMYEGIYFDQYGHPYLFPEPLGQNIYVPGVVTDVWLNTDSGEITACNAGAQLHNPPYAYYQEIETDDDTIIQRAIDAGQCVRGPAPINRIFSFNIYLPRNPQYITKEGGVSNPPPVPIYYDVLGHTTPSPAGPDPQIEIITEIDQTTGEDITYLKVTLDLSGYDGYAYERKIVAGWAYPSPNNWGLEEWKLQIKRLDVIFDGDFGESGCIDCNPGEWNFWINTNNTTSANDDHQEWRLLLNNENVDDRDDITFDDRPWETGATTADRDLGPDLLRYPDRNDVCLPDDDGIIIHSTGYDKDGIMHDSNLGTAFKEIAPANQINLTLENTCSGYCGFYTLHYNILNEGSVGNAVLSNYAQILYALYTASSHTMKNPGVAPLPVKQIPIDIEAIALAPQQPPLSIFSRYKFPIYKQPSKETHVITDISIEDLYETITRTLDTEPEKVHTLLDNIRHEINVILSSSNNTDVYDDLPRLRASLTDALWSQHFGDLIIPGQETNNPPIANAGQDLIVETASSSGASVTLDGTGSIDPDNNLLIFTWTGPFGMVTGATPTVNLPIGTHILILTVIDSFATTGTDTVEITVRDTTPPAILPPADITILSTEAGGARGIASPVLATFLSGGSATDSVDAAPIRLNPQVSGADVDNNTLFQIGTTVITFRFQDASGNIGSANAKVTVVGKPSISGKIISKTWKSPGILFVNLQLTNTGKGIGKNIKIKQVVPRTLSGTGSVTYNTTMSPTLPYTAGDLDIGASATVGLYLNVPSTVTKLSITESGSVQDVLGTGYNYSTGQAVVP